MSQTIRLPVWQIHNSSGWRQSEISHLFEGHANPWSVRLRHRAYSWQISCRLFVRLVCESLLRSTSLLHSAEIVKSTKPEGVSGRSSARRRTPAEELRSWNHRREPNYKGYLTSWPFRRTRQNNESLSSTLLQPNNIPLKERRKSLTCTGLHSNQSRKLRHVWRRFLTGKHFICVKSWPSAEFSRRGYRVLLPLPIPLGERHISPFAMESSTLGRRALSAPKSSLEWQLFDWRLALAEVTIIAVWCRFCSTISFPNSQA